MGSCSFPAPQGIARVWGSLRSTPYIYLRMETAYRREIDEAGQKKRSRDDSSVLRTVIIFSHDGCRYASMHSLMA